MSPPLPTPRQVAVEKGSLHSKPPRRMQRQLTMYEATSPISRRTLLPRTPTFRKGSEKRRPLSTPSGNGLSSINDIHTRQKKSQTPVANTQMPTPVRQFSDVADEKEYSMSTVPSFTPTTYRETPAATAWMTAQSSSEVPLWIPRDERLHWMADIPSMENLSSASMSSNHNGSAGNKSNVPPIDPHVMMMINSDNGITVHTPTRRQKILDWKMFRFMKKQNNETGMPSARRTFRTKRKGLGNLFKSRHELENRMSVDREAYSKDF